MNKDKLLTTKEVSEILRCSIGTVRIYIRAGKFKNCIFVGKQFLIPQSALDEFIENSNVEGDGRID